MKFNESRTYGNLLKAMDGELRAGTRYRMFAENAEKEGLRPVSNMLMELSQNEQEHARVWNTFLNQGQEKSTLDNLNAAVKEEQNEWMRLYEEFANVAAEEGFHDIADMFRRVALIEHHHDIIIKSLIRLLETNTLFGGEDDKIWKCSGCGYLYYGKFAPEKCPVCGFPKDFYERLCEEEED